MSSHRIHSRDNQLVFSFAILIKLASLWSELFVLSSFNYLDWTNSSQLLVCFLRLLSSAICLISTLVLVFSMNILFLIRFSNFMQTIALFMLKEYICKRILISEVRCEKVYRLSIIFCCLSFLFVSTRFDR